MGIPHIIFTGGEPTLREDLPELIAHAEHNGQITGLNTNARRLSDARYVEKLVEAGLDHVQITLEVERRRDPRSDGAGEGRLPADGQRACRTPWPARCT